MYPIVLASLAKFKTLSNRLLFAHKLDNINTPVSTIAPASTALSNTVWTAARANNLNASLASRASQASASALSVDVNALASNIDVPLSNCLSTIAGNIQSGVVNTTALQSVSGSSAGIQEYYTDIAISTVSAIDRCVVLLQGCALISGSGQYPQNPFIWGELLGYLLDASTLRISAISNQGLAYLRGGWFVIEWD